MLVIMTANSYLLCKSVIATSYAIIMIICRAPVVVRIQVHLELPQKQEVSVNYLLEILMNT